jgi:hypothetical protein
MKSLLLGLLGSLGLLAAIALATTALAAPADDSVMTPIHQFIDGFNKGDQKSAAAAFAPTSLAIIDEVPPYVWVGPKALQAWVKDLTAHDKKSGVTDQKVTLGDATRTITSDDRGYVVVPATYTYSERGAPIREPAQMTYALQKGAHGWKITGFTWVGTVPQPANAQ